MAGGGASSGAGGGGRTVVGVLKIMFLLHLILSAWGMQSGSPFVAPNSYIYYNIIYMGTLMWAIVSKTGLESVSLAVLVNISIIALDAITLSLYWPWGGTRGRVYFAFAIANAVLRAVTCMLLYRLFQERDVDNIGFSGVFSDVVGPHGVIQAAMGQGGTANSGSSESTPIAQNQPSSASASREGYQAV